MIYTLKNGQNVQAVYVNGKLIPRAFFADELKGKVKYYRYPFKQHKYGKRLLTRTVHGKVKIVFR